MNETIDNCKVTDFKNCNKKINESDKKYKILKGKRSISLYIP